MLSKRKSHDTGVGTSLNSYKGVALLRCALESEEKNRNKLVVIMGRHVKPMGNVIASEEERERDMIPWKC